MPGESKIEWTDATWNPVTGCTQVSPGCDHCYALTFAERFRGVPNHPYEQGFDLKLWPARLDIPIRWQKPRRIFVNSMSDLFHADVPTEFIAQVFAAMALSPHHTFQVLTKRPQRMARLLNDDAFLVAVGAEMSPLLQHVPMRIGAWQAIQQACTVAPDRLMPAAWPLPNVWMGTSVESQEYTHRIDWLLKTPAAVRFLSCEPLLGPLDLKLEKKPRLCPACGSERRWERVEISAVDAVCDSCGRRGAFDELDDRLGRVDLHWIITGGESGPGFRPVDPEWVRSIRDQCQDAGVAYFHKQWGGNTSKAGGRDLDGREWSEFPAAAAARQRPLMEVGS